MKFLLIFLIVYVPFFSFTQIKEWDNQFLNLSHSKKILKWEQCAYAEDIFIVYASNGKYDQIYLTNICSDYDINGNDSLYICDIRPILNSKFQIKNTFVEIDSIYQYQYGEYGYEYENKIVYTIVKKNKYYGILYSEGDYYCDGSIEEPTDFFEEIDIKHSKGTYILVKQNKKWGIYDFYNKLFVLNPYYSNKNEVPKHYFNMTIQTYREISLINKNRKLDYIDDIKWDTNNGDGVMIARSQKTHKWGMYQGWNGEYSELIPMKFDSIQFFSWNAYFTMVFNDGKAGAYLCKWSYDSQTKQSVPCIYEDYQKYKYNNQIYLAVKKEGNWGWVDWLSGEEKSDFIYLSKEDLPYPNYKQLNFYD